VANLNVETTQGNDTLAVVAPTGELDLSGVPMLEQELDRLTKVDGLRTVVLDLRGLEFIDSSGLRLVIVADRRCRAAGLRFALVPGPEIVHRVFEITRMSEHLEFVDDPSEVTAR
jgi:anti-sigma B factor antagonist